MSIVAVHGPTMATPSNSTGVTVGTPGTFNPGGSTIPASVAALQASGLAPSPATAWTGGTYMQTGTAGVPGRAYWNGTAWVAGVAP